MDYFILIKLIINIFSVVLHAFLILLLGCTPSLSSTAFDALFFSQNIGDMVAVLLRIVTKYAPALLLQNHTGLIEFDKTTFPLATMTNAAEWYSNYVIIFSALMFSTDRAILALSTSNYVWICNPFFKGFLVFFTWIVPLVWLLPMIDTCCRSQYYDNSIENVEMQRSAADTAYDAIDMVFETLFFVPILAILNGFTLMLVYTKWNRMAEKMLRKDVRAIPLTLMELCVDVHIPGTEKIFPSERLLRRLDFELSCVMMSLIDQQIDFFSVTFYTLYWARYSNFIELQSTDIFVNIYSYCFEIGTIITPYVLLIFCDELRQVFFGKFANLCKSSRHE